MATSKSFKRSIPALLAGIMLTGTMASAAPVVIELGREYAFNTQPAGAGPFLRATFTQTGTDTVAIRLERLFSDPQATINRWLFNLDPSMNLSQLEVSQVGGPVAHVHKNANGVGAGGGSLFDIRLLWPASPGRKFDGSHSEANFIMSMPGLTTESFLFGSVGGQAHATNLASVALVDRVQGTQSGWFTHSESSPSVVPLPPAVWAGAAGLAMVGAYIRRRRA
jgi:hypothetical protein